jgi:hypothetical protein
MAAREDEPQPVVHDASLGVAGSGSAARARQFAQLATLDGARRSTSIARLRATVMSQPPGLAGTPSAGQRSTASAIASWAQSSASVQSPVTRIRAATILGYESAAAAADRLDGHTVPNGRSSSRPPRAIGWARATSIASSRSAHLEDVVAHDHLLGLRERAVGDQQFAVADPYRGGGRVGASTSPSRRRPRESLSATQTSMSGRRLVGVRLGIGADEHHVLHRGAPPVVMSPG